MAAKMETDQNLPIQSELLADHIAISGLVQKVLDGFAINTIGDLCCLNLQVVAGEKGVGVKKLETLRDLIEQARHIANYTPENPSSRRLDESGLSSDDVTPLLFVPSLLTEGFRRLEIDCVVKLLQLEERDMAKLPSWGGKKSSATLALRQLYQTLWAEDESLTSCLLSAIVPAELLPDKELADLTIKAFCD